MNSLDLLDNGVLLFKTDSRMLITESLPFIRDYVAQVNDAIQHVSPGKRLTRLQCYWLAFVILGILVTNSLCWARFERFGLARFKVAQLSWMFRRAKIFFDLLLHASILHLVAVYKITSGVLAIDDTDHERSKNTTQIAKTHKLRDKKTGGYVNGQNVVFLLLVTESVTLPVGFCFYQPDPAKTAWRKEDARLRAKGVEKKYRPKPPEATLDYPSKKAIALKLLSEFKALLPALRIRAIVADQYYGTLDLMENAVRITGQPQVISQIRKDQLIIVNNEEIRVDTFFGNYTGRTEPILLRGEPKEVTYRSGKFKVKSHGKKYRVIALKYEGETDYRYFIASDMSWRDEDIIKTYALRWLVEVFIQDWKSYEGWNQLAKQPGFEGSHRGLTLSLLCDHALLLHEDQKALLEHKKPALTVGSLREKVMMESLTNFIEEIVTSENPKALFDDYADKISELFSLRTSIKHLSHVEMEFLENPVLESQASKT